MSVTTDLTLVLDSPLQKYGCRKQIYRGYVAGDGSGGDVSLLFKGNAVKQDSRSCFFYLIDYKFMSTNASTDIAGLIIKSNQWSRQPNGMAVPDNVSNHIFHGPLNITGYNGSSAVFTTSVLTTDNVRIKPYELGSPLTFDTAELISGYISPNTNAKGYYLWLSFIILP